MRKFLFLGIACLCVLCFYCFKFKTSPPNYLRQDSEIYIEKIEEKNKEIIEVIDQINKETEKISSLYVGDVSIKLNQKATFKVKGTMAFSRDKNFRMNIYSGFGKEMDIGSNKEYFWFWSRSMNPPNLYYYKHSDIKNSSLKSPLNPNWLLESLTIMNLDKSKIEIGRFKNFYIVFQKRLGNRDEEVTIATLINPDTKLISGNYLYRNGKLVASSEISGHHPNRIPKNIFIIWYEEGITMEWQLNNPKTNVEINQTMWDLPLPKTSNLHRFRL